MATGLGNSRVSMGSFGESPVLMGCHKPEALNLTLNNEHLQVELLDTR